MILPLRSLCFLVMCPWHRCSYVTPAEAGVQERSETSWISAFAGMTPVRGVAPCVELILQEPIEPQVPGKTDMAVREVKL